MAQLSPSTSIFDQVATSLSAIAEKLKNGKYITKQDLMSDFNQALNEAYKNIDSFNTKLYLFLYSIWVLATLTTISVQVIQLLSFLFFTYVT